MKQRIVSDSFWSDPYIEDLRPNEKLIFLYLLTNPLNNIAGIYEIKIKRISYEIGIATEEVASILDKFIIDGKILRLDDRLVLKNFAKYQSLNPNVIKGMERIIRDLPLKVRQMKGFESLSHFTLLNLTILNSTKPNSTKPNSTENQASEDFKKFFLLYPKHINEKKAETEFAKLKQDEIKKLFLGLENYLKKWKKEGTDLRFIPLPNVWIADERRKDEIDTGLNINTKHKQEKDKQDKNNQEQESQNILKQKKAFSEYFATLSKEKKEFFSRQAKKNLLETKRYSEQKLSSLYCKPLIEVEIRRLVELERGSYKSPLATDLTPKPLS